MNTYEIELESPVDSQSKRVSLQAESEAAARQHVEAKELAVVNFSLLPPSKDDWEQGVAVRHTRDGDAQHAHVDLSAWDAYHPDFARHAASQPYSDAVKLANRRLADLSNRIDIAPNGKVRYSNLSSRAKARYVAHHQLEPYAISDVRQVDQAEIDAQRLVRQIQQAQADPRTWRLALARMQAQGIPLNSVTASLMGLPWEKQIDGSSATVLSTATIQCSLHTALTANNDTNDFFDDVSSTEITGTGYTAKGVTLTSKTSNYTTATDLIWLDAADASWATSTLSATDAELWVDTAGASSTDPLWGNIDFGATVTTTAGTFLITFDATGGIVSFDVT